jgi:hypothetical protein
LAVVVALASPAYAAPPKGRAHPGFLPAQPFLDLALPDDEIVEVNVGPELLRALAQGVEDADAARLLNGIVAVHAVVIGLSGDAVPSRLDGARHLVLQTTDRLLGSGWESLVRVSKKSSTVSVLTKATGAEGKVEGLAVLVVDIGDDGPQIVFANIAGTLDMNQIRRLSAGLNLPGLDRIEDVPGD